MPALGVVGSKWIEPLDLTQTGTYTIKIDPQSQAAAAGFVQLELQTGDTAAAVARALNRRSMEGYGSLIEFLNHLTFLSLIERDHFLGVLRLNLLANLASSVGFTPGCRHARLLLEYAAAHVERIALRSQCCVPLSTLPGGLYSLPTCALPRFGAANRTAPMKTAANRMRGSFTAES